MKQLLIIMLLLVSACSTTRTPIEQAATPHWSQSIANQEPTQDATAKVVVVRDEGFAASLCSFAIAINEKMSGLLESGEQATFYAMPGPLKVSVAGDPSSACSWANPWRDTTTTIKEDETKYFRVGYYMDPVGWVPLIGWFTQDSRMFIQPYDAPEPGETDFTDVAYQEY